jgi:tetratricopeptide (TPR) repeat protein
LSSLWAKINTPKGWIIVGVAWLVFCVAGLGTIGYLIYLSSQEVDREGYDEESNFRKSALNMMPFSAQDILRMSTEPGLSEKIARIGFLVKNVYKSEAAERYQDCLEDINMACDLVKETKLENTQIGVVTSCLRAQILKDLKNYDEALKIYRQQVVHPMQSKYEINNRVNAYFYLTWTYWPRKYDKQIISILDDYLQELDKQSAPQSEEQLVRCAKIHALTYKADMHQSLKQYNLAERSAKEAVQYAHGVTKRPNFYQAKALRCLSRILSEAGLRSPDLLKINGDGQAEITRAVELQPNNKGLTKQRIDQLMDYQKQAAALDVCNEACKYFDDPEDLCDYRAIILMSMQKYEDARKQWDKLIEDDDQNSDYYRQRAICWHALGDDKRAAQDYKQEELLQKQEAEKQKRADE